MKNIYNMIYTTMIFAVTIVIIVGNDVENTKNTDWYEECRNKMNAVEAFLNAYKNITTNKLKRKTSGNDIMIMYYNYIIDQIVLSMYCCYGYLLCPRMRAIKRKIKGIESNKTFRYLAFKEEHIAYSPSDWCTHEKPDRTAVLSPLQFCSSKSELELTPKQLSTSSLEQPEIFSCGNFDLNKTPEENDEYFQIIKKKKIIEN